MQFWGAIDCKSSLGQLCLLCGEEGGDIEVEAMLGPEIVVSQASQGRGCDNELFRCRGGVSTPAPAASPESVR
jgi:hypothetical protein